MLFNFVLIGRGNYFCFGFTTYYLLSRTYNSFFCISACNEKLTSMSGYFFSPSHPANFLDDVCCTWHITVPTRHIIHLEFQEFRLTDHPTCDNCFLEIYDGRDSTAPSLGRFCGYFYPPVFFSSSNHFTILLKCSGNVPVARFKAFYHSVSGT